MDVKEFRQAGQVVDVCPLIPSRSPGAPALDTVSPAPGRCSKTPSGVDRGVAGGEDQGVGLGEVADLLGGQEGSGELV